MAHQIGGVLRGLAEIDAKADFVYRAGAEQQLAAALIQFPYRAHLTEKHVGQLTHARGLFHIDRKTTLDVVQRAAADIAIDREMQHAVNQPLAQRAARQRHAFDAELLKYRNQNGKAAGENQRALQR